MADVGTLVDTWDIGSIKATPDDNLKVNLTPLEAPAKPVSITNISRLWQPSIVAATGDTSVMLNE